MSLFIPTGLREQLPNFGEEGRLWLDGLPDRVSELEREWGFTTRTAFDHNGCVSWVAPVTLQNGSEAVLKIGIPHDEARFEAEALRFWEGHGAVCLLHVSEDGFSLLLERCLPGTDLWSLGVVEGDAVAARLLHNLWRERSPAAPFMPLEDLVAEWCEELPNTGPAGGYDAEYVAHAIELGQALAASQPRKVLLHGDFHPGNVLAAQREPWLVIDPKPLVGDPAYDLAQWLSNRYGAALLADDPVSVLQGQIDGFANRLGLDGTRIAGWAFVKSLGWDWGPPAAALFRQLWNVCQ